MKRLAVLLLAATLTGCSMVHGGVNLLDNGDLATQVVIQAPNAESPLLQAKARVGVWATMLAAYDALKEKLSGPKVEEPVI